MARGKVKRSKSHSKHKGHKKYYGKARKSKLSLKRDSFHGKSRSVDDRGITSSKQRKLPEKPKKNDYDDFSEEEQDTFKKFLNTFGGRNSKSKNEAIESDSSSEVQTESETECSKVNSVSPEKYTREVLMHEEPSNVSDNEIVGSDQDEENDDDLDPFVRHFHYDLDGGLLESVTSLTVERKKMHWPVLGQLIITLPREPEKCKSVKLNPKITIEDVKKYAKQGTIPQRLGNFNSSNLHIKKQIQNNINKANFKQVCTVNESVNPLTPMQLEMFSIINNYQDFYYPDRNLRNGEEIRFLYCLHSVNHILKTRAKILRHNKKLLNNDDVPEEYRDQGLVRPKVIILVPFKESALRVVKMIIDIILPEEKANIMNKKRFFEEFTGSEIAMPKKKPRPEDYEEMFAGNTDDTFRIGISVTKKCLRLYADFYSADIIIASPLGLRVIVGAEGEEGRDFDFLASVELLIMDQVELFLMQNWDHLLHVLDHIHLQPQESHGTNFARVRSWALNGWSRYYRQTLLFSSMMLPEISALMNKKCHNYAGKICVVNPIISGSICHVVVQLPQVFHRFDVQSVAQAVDARFDFFIKKILPLYKDGVMNHILIYIPSYFDYVRLRNYFKREGLNFVQICEYSKEAKIARAKRYVFPR